MNSFAPLKFFPDDHHAIIIEISLSIIASIAIVFPMTFISGGHYCVLIWVFTRPYYKQVNYTSLCLEWPFGLSS